MWYREQQQLAIHKFMYSSYKSQIRSSIDGEIIWSLLYVEVWQKMNQNTFFDGLNLTSTITSSLLQLNHWNIFPISETH